MSVFHASREAILIVTTALGGVFCMAAYLATFAAGRRLHPDTCRPFIGLGDLVKPLAGGMVLGVVVLCVRLHGDADSPLVDTAAAQNMFSVLLCVALAGICAGGWTARPGAAEPRIGAADLVRRLCVAGNTHEDATARVAVRLALAAGFNPARASDLMAAASLHDIGRTGLPAVRHPGCLTEDERLLLQSHTRIGFRMLAQSHEPMLDLAADIALHHHENWDGSGYPAGLSGEQIPLTSRVVALAESFDEILATPIEIAALAEILEVRAGTQFDPRLVALLLGDLPGMIAARGAKVTRTRTPDAPVAAWLRPGAFRPVQPKHIAI